MNQQMAEKLGNFKRENSTLNKKVEQLTADKKSLQLLCAEQQDTITGRMIRFGGSGILWRNDREKKQKQQ